MRNLKAAMFIIVLLLVAFVAWSGGQKEGVSGEASGGGASNELVFALSEEITSTDMHQVYWSNMVHNILYDSLVTFDLENKKILPSAAESYEIRDGGKELVFSFAEDAAFTNGVPMTAEKVKASIERYRELSPYASDFAPITGMEIESGKLVMKFERPTAFIWGVLTSDYAGIVEPAAAESMGKEDFSRAAVTYGPTRVKEWVQGSHITLEAVDNYSSNNPIIENNGPLHINTVTIRFIPDSFTRISELLSGNVDILGDVPVESVEALKKNDQVKLYTTKQPGVDFLYLNPQAEKLQDVKVRRAIAHAINKEEIQAALKDTVNAAYGFLSPAQIAYSADAEKKLKSIFGFDLAKAKNLLAQAGWKDSNGDGVLEKNGEDLELTMLVTLDVPLLKQAAPIVQNQLKQAGIKLNLREFEASYIRQRLGDVDYEIANRHYEWLDPDMFSYLFHSETGQGGYSNTEVDKLIEEGRYIMDMEERAAKYGEVQMTMMEDVPAVPLFYQIQYTATKKNITGLKISVEAKYYIQDVEKR